MLRGVALAILALFSAAAGSVATHAQTRVCNTGTVAVHLAYALDANFTHVLGWHPLEPGDCRQETYGYWLAVRQADPQGRLGIADYRPEFGQRPSFYDNMGRGFCVKPTMGFSKSLAHGNTCGEGEQRVLFRSYARKHEGGLFPPTWSIATKADIPITPFGSGDSNQLDPSVQAPQLDPGDQLALDFIAAGARALLQNSLPDLNLDKYNKPLPGPAPWSEVEEGARERARNDECLALNKSAYHCDHRMQFDDDPYSHVPCRIRLHHYQLCQNGQTEQLKAELDAYLRREKDPHKIEPIVQRTDTGIAWDYGKVPITFHPPLADAVTASEGKMIMIFMGRDTSNSDDALLTKIALYKFKRNEWQLSMLPPPPPQKLKIVSEDKSAIDGSLILQCGYYRPSTQRDSVTFHWYRQVPPAASPSRLKERLSDHPLLEFGEAREVCPTKLEGTATGRLKTIFPENMPR